jgi:hypothetical protein
MLQVVKYLPSNTRSWVQILVLLEEEEEEEEEEGEKGEDHPGVCVWWHTSIIPATWEDYSSRPPGKKDKTTSEKLRMGKRAGGVVEV